MRCERVHGLDVPADVKGKKKGSPTRLKKNTSIFDYLMMSGIF